MKYKSNCLVHLYFIFHGGFAAFIDYAYEERRIQYLKATTSQHADLKHVVFPCKQCFIAITNFGGVNVYPEKYTAYILRRYLPANVGNIGKGYSSPSYIKNSKNLTIRLIAHLVTYNSVHQNSKLP